MEHNLEGKTIEKDRVSPEKSILLVVFADLKKKFKARRRLFDSLKNCHWKNGSRFEFFFSSKQNNQQSTIPKFFRPSKSKKKSALDVSAQCTKCAQRKTANYMPWKLPVSDTEVFPIENWNWKKLENINFCYRIQIVSGFTNLGRKMADCIKNLSFVKKVLWTSRRKNTTYLNPWFGKFSITSILWI